MAYEDALSAVSRQADRLADYKKVMEKRLLDSKEYELQKKLESVTSELTKCRAGLQKEL